MPKKTNRDRIIETIKEYQPIKAKKIAEILSLDTSFVNSILYRQEMKKYVVRDKKYQWSLYVSSKKIHEEKVKNADPLLNRLCKYYLQCLSREQVSVGTFARSKYDNLPYAQLSNFDTGKPDFEYIETINSDDLNRIKGNIDKSQRGYNNAPQQPCIGYPVYLKKIISPKGEWYFVEPIFVITIDSDTNEMQDIRLNSRAIESLLGTTNPMNRLDEMNNINSALELHANSDEISLIPEMLENLRNERPEWPWSDNFSDYNNETDLSKIDEDGKIYNVAIYTGMDQSKYTRGLESELQALSIMSTKDISGTALYHWLYNNSLDESTNAKAKEKNKNGKIYADWISDRVIEPIKLNNEQLSSVKRALVSKLSVISGPPGTGKSQVVSSLLVNSIYNNKTALFSSKNNQAVDVVINRTNTLSTTPVLLHLSKQRKYSKLKQYCESIIGNPPNTQMQRKLERSEKLLKDIKKQIDNIESEEQSYLDKVSKSEGKFDELLSHHALSKNNLQSHIDYIQSNPSFKSDLLEYHKKLGQMIKLLKKLEKEFNQTNKKMKRTLVLYHNSVIDYYNKNIDPDRDRGFFDTVSYYWNEDEYKKKYKKLLKRSNDYNIDVFNAKKPPKKLKKLRYSRSGAGLNYNGDIIEKYEETNQKVNCNLLTDKSSEKFISLLKDLNTIGKRLFEGKHSNHKLDKKNIFACEKSVKKAIEKSEFYKDVLSYLKSLDKIHDLEDTFDLSKKLIKLQEKKAIVSSDIWEFYTKVRTSKFNKEIKKDISAFLTYLGLLEDRNIRDGDQISGQLAVQFNKHLKKVMKIAPCWSVTSLSAKSKIPFEPKQFQLLIIDEASQNDIASVLPLLYRCESAVIIGDEMQLKHISGINVDEDTKLLDSYDLLENNIMWSYSQNSLFKLSDTLVDDDNKVHLLDHFRSHSDIIGFANNEFYGGSLRIATDYKNLKIVKDEKVIKWINVNGKATKPNNNRSLINYDEIKAMIKELNRLKSTGYEGSIGVVTPYRAQANLMQKELLKDEALHSWFLSDRGGSINTVHLFQGDERDIMFFSAVVTKDINPSVMNFFKPNLFNVAITRARAALWVFGNQEDCLNFNHDQLAKLANYINNIHSETVEEEDIQIPKFKGNKYPHEHVKEIGVRYSDYEVLFYEELCKHGIRTVPQYSVDQYKLDLALFDENNPERKLNIELDGAEFHSDEKGELIIKDRIRNLKMIELGWDVQRFWNHQIRDNLEECINQVLYWKNNSLEE